MPSGEPVFDALAAGLVIGVLVVVLIQVLRKFVIAQRHVDAFDRWVDVRTPFRRWRQKRRDSRRWRA